MTNIEQMIKSYESNAFRLLTIEQIANLINDWRKRGELLRRVDHTLSVHGHIDANTDLHQLIKEAL